MILGDVQIPADVKPGERIRAEDINQILWLLRQIVSIKGEGSIEVVRTGSSIVVRPRADYTDELLYRITAIRVSGSISTSTLGETVSDQQSLITYDLKPWRGIEHPELTDEEPTLGRPEENGDMEILSAAVGDPVRVYTLNRRNGTTRRFVEVLNERNADPVICETSP